MNSYVIETRNLTKCYRNQTAVNQVNLHVPKGKIYGLLGRNGAGKTTTMKMLLGLAAPTEGQVLLLERTSEGMTKFMKGIGSLIEAPAFYENLTAGENLRILARLRGRHRQDTVERALEVVGLGGEKRKAFREYSLGMKQRLGIAAAIMHEPELLILDEPINGLDPVGIHEIRGYLLELCRERGTTIFLSSHVLSEVEQLADVVGVMHKGRLLEETDMGELRKRSRRYVEFAVSDVNKAARVLELVCQTADYSIAEGNRLRLYELPERRGEINASFVKEGVDVLDMTLCEEKLEDYFSGLIGGGGIG